MDLVFNDAIGWVIANYKSKSYYNQVLTYKKVWEKLTNEKIQSVELYFAHIGEIVKVPLTEEFK